ncbi:MAG: carbon-nitrogen hydrolase family protein [Nanoarchaeota archaeon]|nr:carbon-nitrogen hydrolase family protein [Nanoarchaeota archaeon]
MKVKIAVVQFKVRKVSEEENLKKAEEFIKKAASLKADIIVFPEDFVTRTTPEDTEFFNSKKHLKHFQKLAKKYKIDIVPGSFIEKEGSKLHNTSHYIDYRGEILAKYEKIHLWVTERKKMKPGRKVSVFKTRHGKIGMIICWDLMFPEMFRKMTKKGVQIIICPAYWCYEDAGKGLRYDKNSEIKLVDSLCVDRAFEEEVILVFCNAAGNGEYKNKNESLVGHSQITVPFKGSVKKLNHNKEDMIIQEVDTSILKDAEASYKIRKK